VSKQAIRWQVEFSDSTTIWQSAETREQGIQRAKESWANMEPGRKATDAPIYRVRSPAELTGHGLVLGESPLEWEERMIVPMRRRDIETLQRMAGRIEDLQRHPQYQEVKYDLEEAKKAIRRAMRKGDARVIARRVT